MAEKPTAVIYSGRFLDHKTGVHCEAPSRLKIAMETLQNPELKASGKFTVIEPRLASKEEIALVHSVDYIEEVRSFCARGGGYYDGDTPLSPESFEVASLAVGGLLEACEKVFSGDISNAFALVRPPGHHAGIHGRALGALTNGFCVFNNVAAATAYAAKKGWARRSLIFDFDTHHGNGTQEIFNSDAQVLYLSLHQRGIYPGTGYEDEIGVGAGRGFKVNVPLPARSDDEVYLKVLGEIVEPVAEQFKPELILLSAGYDAHHSDIVGGMFLSAEGFAKMVESMVKLARKSCGGKLLACLEGGYSAQALSQGIASSLAAMAGISLSLRDHAPRSPSHVQSAAAQVIRKVKDNLGSYWSL
ncbi:histone deacetylase [Candidatus Hecatella orcuttiae]|jgi:acetoin utilization deacetylase AcuC-like enzyme|uniref:histone deacetylase family protein n=1 Tax=Candidatus Hecatella orcuttiae TaxID=1935119 RepID=UPI0028681520|nr:histone deacetylase [Candidatus Hecatella orcuttiae]